MLTKALDNIAAARQQLNGALGASEQEEYTMQTGPGRSLEISWQCHGQDPKAKGWVHNISFPGAHNSNPCPTSSQ